MRLFAPAGGGRQSRSLLRSLTRTAGPQEPAWRQVPKVNVLPTSQGTISRTVMLRGLLVLILLVGLYVAFSQNNRRGEIDLRNEEKTAQLQNLRRQLATSNQQEDVIRTQINQLKLEQENTQSALQLLTAGRIDWFGAFDTLFQVQTNGVSFTALTAGPTGNITLRGEVSDTASMESLPTRLDAFSEILELQTFVPQGGTEGEDGPDIFTAAFTMP